MEKELKAEWAIDYDFRTDSCYNRPSCPECREPIVKREDGEYYCLSCGRNVKVTNSEMQDWFKEREGVKVGMRDCLHKEMGGCGGKKCVEAHYIRNYVTLKWQIAGGFCTKCGLKFIV